MSEERNDPYDGYYAPTAYDSRRDGLPPDPRTSEGGDTILGRSMREYALRVRGIQCREYLANADLDFIELLGMENDPEVKKQLKGQGNTLEWSTLKNPAAATEVFAGVMQIFFIFSIPGLILIALIAGITTDAMLGGGITPRLVLFRENIFILKTKKFLRCYTGTSTA